MSSPAVRHGRLNVFLSHRYHSPVENQYFWKLLSSEEDVSFRVDEAVSFTSPVRLERLIRDADGFVGIHPLPGGPREVHLLPSLRHTARYFRLELGMAVRARKPAVVFLDQRLIPALRAPESVRLVPYDAQEIDAANHSSLPSKVESVYRGFLADAHAVASAPQRRAHQTRRVGLIVSPDNRPATSALSEALHERAWEPVVLPWPPRLDLDLITWLRACDWTVIDLDSPPGRLVAAFAHGQFVPTLPIASTRSALETDVPVPDESTLYGETSVGHRKAIVRWSDLPDLITRLGQHLSVIDDQPRYIGSTEQAVAYFRSAAKRNERVFLSYAAADEKRAGEFSRLLSDRFQEVFDYRSYGAVPVGEPWLSRLLSGLARSAIGVLLVSKAYLESRYCMLEARELYRGSVEGRVKIVPVCLERLELPDFLQGIQYRALYRHSPQEILAELTAQLGPNGEP
ncbi:toll/interleukin-1 receptor domain-containing protein [Streptomyces sp. NPDC059445]|uniref:toll/interleukin-1 receptor domain-containing protein n=1 Tax=Streptomyces sp. NPDC059445 TaxID=3346832 RepID=UPI0036B36A12